MSCKRVIYFHNGSIGDFLLTLHVMENLHENDPQLPLAIAVPRNIDACRELAKNYPHVDVLSVNKITAPKLLGTYMKGGNCVVTPPTAGHLPLSTKLIAKLLSVMPGERLIGFDDGGALNKLLYNKLLEYDTSKLFHETMHELVRALGYEVLVPEPTFSFERVPEVFERFSLEPHRYVVVHPFGSSKGRSVLDDELRVLIRNIREHYDGAVVLSGSAKDYDEHRMLIDELANKHGIIPIPGRISILELATLLQDASGYIGVDTGVTHLASLLRTKSLVLAHNGTPNWLPYYNENARIIYQIRDDESGVHEGREHLVSKRAGRTHYLERISAEVVEKALTDFFHE